MDVKNIVISGNKESDLTMRVLNEAETKRTYSTIFNNDPIGSVNAISRLDSKEAWKALNNDGLQWMVIDVGSKVKVHGIVV